MPISFFLLPKVPSGSCDLAYQWLSPHCLKSIYCLEGSSSNWKEKWMNGWLLAFFPFSFFSGCPRGERYVLYKWSFGIKSPPARVQIPNLKNNGLCLYRVHTLYNSNIWRPERWWAPSPCAHSGTILLYISRISVPRIGTVPNPKLTKVMKTDLSGDGTSVRFGSFLRRRLIDRVDY